MRVLVTRSKRDAWTLSNPLREAGLEPVEVPLIDYEYIPGALMPFVMYEYDILLLTSAAAVEAVAAAYHAGMKEIPRVYAVGPATAVAAEARGMSLELIPDVHTATRAIDRMGIIWDKEILWPCGERVTEGTLQRMSGRGAVVQKAVVYRNVAPDGYAEQLARALPVDIVTLTSGSCAERLADAGLDLGGARIVAIGPSTAAACEAVGLAVSAVAEPHTAAGIVSAIAGLT